MSYYRLDATRFAGALRDAVDLHRGQVRKGTGIPYIAHLLAVTAIVLEHGADEDEAIAAMLHDSLEDAGPVYPGGPDALRHTIAERYGPRVLEIVEACTDTVTLPKPPWRPRKEAYLAHLRTATPSALLVSCADKLHNARAILSDYRLSGNQLWERFTGGRDGTLWYYRALVETFRNAPATPSKLLDELDRVVSGLEALVDAQALAGPGRPAR